MAINLPDGLFSLVPNELLIEVVRPLSTSDLIAVSLTSSTFRQRILPLIGAQADLISRICSDAITYQDEEEVSKIVTLYAELVDKRTLSLHLTIDLETLWHGTQAALDKIAALFTTLDTITFTHPHKGDFNQAFYPALPSCIKKLVIEKVASLPLARMCQKLTQLVELRCIFSKDPLNLEREIINFPYPNTFEYLAVDLTRFSSSFSVSLLSNTRATRADTSLAQANLAIEEKNIGRLLEIAKLLHSKEVAHRAFQLLDRRHLSKDTVIAHLEKITEIDPTHIEAVLELHLLTESEYSTNCLDAIKQQFGNEHFLVALVSKPQVPLFQFRSTCPEIALNQLCGNYSNRLSRFQTTTSWLTALSNDFLKLNKPIEPLFCFWINYYQTCANFRLLQEIYIYLHEEGALSHFQKELAETLIPVCHPDLNLRYELLHNLLTNEDDISESELSYRLFDFLKQKKAPTMKELTTIFSLFEKKQSFSRLKIRLAKYIDERQLLEATFASPCTLNFT